MTRFVIVRHGNTFEAGEAPRRVGARTDLPLTAAGLEQAKALRRHFDASGVQFDRVLSSALQRTRMTAEAIAGGTDVAIESASFLTEIDHGPDENRGEDEVKERLGQEALTLWERDMIAPQGWEVGAEWRLAAWRQFAEEATEAAPDSTILLVTSNGAARFALAALGLRTGENGETERLRTGSYGLIRSATDGFHLAGWNIRPGEPAGHASLF